MLNPEFFTSPTLVGYTVQIYLLGWLWSAQLLRSDKEITRIQSSQNKFRSLIKRNNKNVKKPEVMMKMYNEAITKPRFNKKTLRKLIKPSALASSLLVLAVNQAHALSWQLENGVTIDLDTSLTYDAQWRQEERDNTILSEGGGGLPNFLTDDGNLNFDDGDMTQNRFSFSSDLDVNFGDGGVFVRVRGWYDDIYKDSSLAGDKKFQRDGIDIHGSDIELLDAFIYYTFDIGERSLSLRAGDQVVNWGESLYVFGGISAAQGPIDATKANAPGVELKDIFLPIGQVYAEVDLTDSFSVGAYYQYGWEEIRVDAPGSYFNVVDVLGQGSVGDTLDIFGLPIVEDTPDKGQWGIAVRYLAAELNNTEFGLYYLNYNDFIPTPQLLPPILGPQLTHEYFEDINLLGASFGTVFGDTNVSGEVSYRDGQPVQLKIPGAFYFTDAETLQAQISIIHLISGTALADSLTLIGEVGYNRVLDIDADLTAQAVGVDVNDIDSALEHDRNAAGATVSVKADYFSIVSGLDLAITSTYRNDFNGVSAVAFTFTEGVEQLSLTADFSYLNNHNFGVSYVNFLTDPDEILADEGRLEIGHLNADRDYVAVYYKYRF
ncbi:DUF1302 family protein [Thalassotalea fonticola]|uniref:DUF1302 family protein n=1 Tax=Thalassotalea fonticola TaxID=3065649 RepID=A0ABZ0GR51_9GAMM|nr:DUF1302 family protein [Colwelliaceae bacterium S1-1]